MDSSTIEKEAKKLHRRWLSENDDFVKACRNKPKIYMQSHDFARAQEWDKLPAHWRDHYCRQARYAMLHGRSS